MIQLSKPGGLMKLVKDFPTKCAFRSAHATRLAGLYAQYSLHSIRAISPFGSSPLPTKGFEMKALRVLLCIVMAVTVVLLIGPSAAAGQQDDNHSLVYPPDSQPFGMTYGDWQAA